MGHGGQRVQLRANGGVQPLPRLPRLPWPLFAAFVSAYAQFICGLLFMVGAFTRPAAAVMLINFTVALVLVHVGQPFLENYDALVMLFGAAFLLVHGPGRVSIDAERGGE